MEHSDDQNVQLSTDLLYEQYSRWKAKAKAKQIYLAQSEIDTYESWYRTRTTQSLKACVWRCRIPLYPPAPSSKADLATELSEVWSKVHTLVIAQKFIWKAYDTPRTSYVHSYMMNPDEEHHEYQTFWWRTQQHSDVHPGNTTTFWWSECSALHMLYIVNSTIGEKLKSKAKVKILS